MLRILLSFVLATTAATVGYAQSDVLPECPDTIVEFRPGTAEIGPSVDCAGISGTFYGITFSVTTGCPTFIIVTPPHTVSIHSPGSKQYAVPVGHTSRVLLSFDCKRSWIFFSSCVNTGTTILDNRPSWAPQGCARRNPS